MVFRVDIIIHNNFGDVHLLVHFQRGRLLGKRYIICVVIFDVGSKFFDLFFGLTRLGSKWNRLQLCLTLGKVLSLILLAIKGTMSILEALLQGRMEPLDSAGDVRGFNTLA